MQLLFNQKKKKENIVSLCYNNELLSTLCQIKQLLQSMCEVCCIVYSINMRGIVVQIGGTKFIEPFIPFMGIYALSIANIVVLWNWNRVVEDKISLLLIKV